MKSHGTPGGPAKQWIGELTQLRVRDIEQRACGSALRIAPDAGTVKTGKDRTIHLVEMGLLAYVEVRKAQIGAAAVLPSPEARS